MNLKTLKSVVNSQTNASMRWTLSSVGAKAVHSKSTSKTRTKNTTRAGAVPPKCAAAVNKFHIKGSHASRTKKGNFKMLASFFALSVKPRLCVTSAAITWRVQSAVMSSAGFVKITQERMPSTFSMITFWAAECLWWTNNIAHGTIATASAYWSFLPFFSYGRFLSFFTFQFLGHWRLTDKKRKTKFYRMKMWVKDESRKTTVQSRRAQLSTQYCFFCWGYY